MNTFYVLISNLDGAMVMDDVITATQAANGLVVDYLPNFNGSMYYFNISLPEGVEVSTLSFSDRVYEARPDGTDRFEVRMNLETGEWDYEGSEGLLMRSGNAT